MAKKYPTKRKHLVPGEYSLGSYDYISVPVAVDGTEEYKRKCRLICLNSGINNHSLIKVDVTRSFFFKECASTHGDKLTLTREY